MSARWPASLALALSAAMVLAGCVAPATSPGPEAALAPSEAPSVWAPHGAFTMTAKDCQEGGFVAAYNTGGQKVMLAEVWETADVREEIGNPMRDAIGRPADGPMMGNWHMGFNCASVTSTGGDAEDFIFGYIGEMVVAPPWDVGGADFHFLLSGLGFQDGPIAEALKATSNADITPATVARVDWIGPKEAPRSAAYVFYQDGKKGDYEGWGTMHHLRDIDARTLRLWWQVPVTGEHDDHTHHNAMNDLFFQGEPDGEGEWHPIFWDVWVSGGPQYTTPPADSVQFGSHNKLKFEHGPIPAQPTLSNVYYYDELTFTSGHVVKDVVLTKLWNH